MPPSLPLGSPRSCTGEIHRLLADGPESDSVPIPAGARWFCSPSLSFVTNHRKVIDDTYHSGSYNKVRGAGHESKSSR